MRFNRIRAISALLSTIALLPFCSRTDVITGAGDSIVGGIDSTLIAEPGRAFARVTLDSLYNRPKDIVDSVFSLPASRDSLFGTYTSGGIIIGVSDEEDTLAAHVQYKIKGGASSINADSADVDSVKARIYFRAANSGSATDRITLFRSAPLGEFAPVDRDMAISDSIGSFSLGDSGAVDAVTLPDYITARILKARTSSDTSAFDNIAFSIADYAGTMRKSDNPYIVVTVIKKIVKNGSVSALDTISDTITGSARYTVFESDKASERAMRPYSSQRTRRTAVFRVNMEKAFKSLEAQGLPVGKGEVMNAVAAVLPNLEEGVSKNAGNYLALISDTLLTRDMPSDSAEAADSRLLSNEFAWVRSNVGLTTASTKPYNTHDFKAVLRGVVDKYNSRPSATSYTPYIYIYLRPVTEGSVIVWDEKKYGLQKIDMIFTHLR